MDENLHPIDDLFKKAIDDHDEVPSSKVWENIDKNLDKKKVISITKKYEKWKWVAAALFIFSVGMAMYTWNLKLRYKEVVKGHKVKTTKAFNQKQVTTGDRSNVEDKTVTVKDKKQNSSVNNIKKSTTAPDRITINEQNTIVKVEKSSKLAGKSNINNRITENNIPAVVRQMRKDVYAKNKGQQIKELLATTNITKSDITPKEITSNSESADRNKNISTAADSLYNASLPLEKFEVETSIVSVPKNLLQVPPPVISAKDISSISTVSNNSNTATKASGSLKGLKPLKNTVSIFFSPGVVSTRLRNDLQHFREDDRHEIKQNETNNYAYTIGAMVERNIASNLSILSGLSLATRVTENNSKTLFARPDNSGNVNYRISCSAGYAYVTSKRAGPGGGSNRPSPGDTIQSLSSTTTLQYLSVPAGLRYHLNKGKFSFNPAVALAANFITKKKIETVLFAAGGNENTTTGDIQGLKPAYFDGSIRTDLAYNLGRTIGISLLPSARFALSSITKDGPVKTYVNTFGLGIGLNVHF